MKKFMVYADDEQHEKLRKASYEQRISMAEIIRRALDKYLEEQESNKKKS